MLDDVEPSRSFGQLRAVLLGDTTIWIMPRLMSAPMILDEERVSDLSFPVIWRPAVSA